MTLPKTRFSYWNFKKRKKWVKYIVVDGIAHGLTIEYLEDGKTIKNKIVFIKGIPEGEAIDYDNSKQ